MCRLSAQSLAMSATRKIMVDMIVEVLLLVTLGYQNAKRRALLLSDYIEYQWSL